MGSAQGCFDIFQILVVCRLKKFQCIERLFNVEIDFSDDQVDGQIVSAVLCLESFEQANRFFVPARLGPHLGLPQDIGCFNTR